MSPADSDPQPGGPEPAPSEPEPRRVRKTTPRKPARTPESALPPRQAIRTKTEIEPLEHPEERKFRLRMAEQQKAFEIHKNRAILYTTLGLVVTLVASSLTILALSTRPELVNFATACLSSCLAGFVGYVTGKADSKKTE
jgi:hypothetical protein